MVVILITVLAQNNMPSKCFITFLNTTVQTERSDSNPRLQPRCLRSSHTSLLRRKVATTSQVQLDLRVLKFFKVGEHGKLDFVVESFNLLNHTSVVALNQFYGSDSAPIPVFATANKAGIPRQLQFSIDFE